MKVAVIGLGYVGLPLAIHFARKYHTIGFDLKEKIILNCKEMKDPTGEVSFKDFSAAVHFYPTSDAAMISRADFIIVAVPTPIDKSKRPDLGAIEKATELVGQYMKKGAVVIFESTVYPGVTEEICVPILEKVSALKWKEDFHVGYSPERINPGDKEHTLTKIVKVVSGDDKETLERIATLYESIIDTGIHRTDTIQEAEAAKVIENTQRDLNISLMNELALIFDTLGIDTKNVLDAAGSKWNFLPFTPGLVGGHCIGVDPYYLTFKAQSEGYHPEVILAGRRINDNMGKFIASKTIKLMIQSDINIKNAKVGILGLTFKENCPDLRNTKVVDIISELKSYGTNILVHDPMADRAEAFEYYNIQLCSLEDMEALDAIIIAVPHDQYKKMDYLYIAEKLKFNGWLVDVKSILDKNEIDQSNINIWRL